MILGVGGFGERMFYLYIQLANAQNVVNEPANCVIYYIHIILSNDRAKIYNTVKYLNGANIGANLW